MVRKGCMLLAALALVTLALPAAAAGTCTAQCNDLTLFSEPASGPSDCYDFGVQACANHSGLKGLLYQP